MPFPSSLRCSSCVWSSPLDGLRNLCPHCSSPLLVHYEIDPAPDLREMIARRPRGLWRWNEVLPDLPPSSVVSLGEGSTPLLPAERLGSRLGLPRLFIKDESLNPTRSFKSRGMAAAVTMARHFKAPLLAAPTAGNAGAALAAYGARAGIPVFVAMPEDTPRSVVEECRGFGAEVELVKGVITDAAKRVQAELAKRSGFDLSTLKEPYRVEGKKIMGYELLEDLGKLPDVILYPTGGGTGLIGMWKAFAEMERLGWIGSERPRMFAVQSKGCAPVVRALEQDLDHAPEWENPRTAAWGLRVPRAVGDRLMLAALRGSEGGGVAVEEESIEPAASEIRRTEGIDAGPEGGAALVALRVLVAEGRIDPSMTVVLFNTGGDKYRD
ncbi:MAG TPA: threonine synthase [Thermoanaerobaculia bacterium]|nr:threonine synthase [Thermoanaerobaculia bacterium]